MLSIKILGLPRPVKCTLRGDELEFEWTHRDDQHGKSVGEINAPRYWTDRTLSAFSRLKKAEEIPAFVERFGILGKPHAGAFERATTWLLWVDRAKAILAFNKAISRGDRPTTAHEDLMGRLMGWGNWRRNYISYLLRLATVKALLPDADYFSVAQCSGSIRRARNRAGDRCPQVRWPHRYRASADLPVGVSWFTDPSAATGRTEESELQTLLGLSAKIRTSPHDSKILPSLHQGKGQAAR
jgi:hypothetical protein